MNLEVDTKGTEWLRQAPCQRQDPETFFPASPEAHCTAVAICNRCPLFQQCARWAVETQQTDGVHAAVLLPGLDRSRALAKARAQLLAIAAGSEEMPKTRGTWWCDCALCLDPDLELGAA